MIKIGSVIAVMVCILLAGCRNDNPKSEEELNRLANSFSGGSQLIDNCLVKRKRFYTNCIGSDGECYQEIYIAECATATITTTIMSNGKSHTTVPVVVPKQLTAEELRKLQKEQALAKLTPEERALFLPDDVK